MPVSAHAASWSGGAHEQDVRARSVGAEPVDDPRGAMTLPFELDILLPSGPRIIPCVNSRWNGSWTPSSSMSSSALTKNREYIRCRIACSTPPMYWSTGIHMSTTCRFHAAASLPASQ